MPKKTGKAPASKAKKAPVKKATKKGSGLSQPLTPSAALAAIVGKKPLARTAAVKKIWAYIKAHKLQSKTDGRIIMADAKLKPIFGGKSQLNMMSLAGCLSNHLK